MSISPSIAVPLSAKIISHPHILFILKLNKSQLGNYQVFQYKKGDKVKVKSREGTWAIIGAAVIGVVGAVGRWLFELILLELICNVNNTIQIEADEADLVRSA